MNFELIFSPDNLIETRKKICRSRDSKAINFLDPEYETEVLVKRLAASPDDMNKAEALSLSEREVNILAGYLPYNHYHLNEKKLCHILKYRMDERACRTLFLQWQESFSNSDCNVFIRALTKSSRAFKKILEEEHIPESVFLEILDSKNIALSFDEELVGKQFLNSEEFENKLRFYGITENSYLDVECKRALMALCGRSDYLECSEENILYIIRGYDYYMLKKFLVNFLMKMDIWELQTYTEIAEYLMSTVGSCRSENLDAFFEDVPSAIAEKYLNWINIIKLNRYFRDDDRSRFWKQYKLENVVKYPVSGVVIMEFEQYVAAEFTDIDNSSLFICDKHSFRQYFYLRLETMGDTDLFKYFLENREKFVLVKNHTGKWQFHVNNAINKKQMGVKIPK